MHLRNATPADIPRLAEIWAVALAQDAFYDVLFPRRAEFFDAYRSMWVSRLQKKFLQYGERFILVETDVVDAAGGRPRKEIAGWAEWMRMGSSEAAQKVMGEEEGVLRALERRVLAMEETYFDPILRWIRKPPGDEYADNEALAQFYADYQVYMKEYWPGEKEEHWHLKMLGVDPKWQRRGIGQMLLRWGLDRAQQEGVPAGLEASDAGGPMYLKAGFEEIGRFVAPGGEVTFPIMMWRPMG